MSDVAGVLETALLAAREGLSTVPPKEDGTKAPLGSWKKYQTTPAGETQIRKWYQNGRQGVGLVCGKVSGGLEMLEFEGRAVRDGIQDRFKELAEGAGLSDALAKIRNGYVERTPTGGIHVLWRCAEVDGNLKLAQRVTGDGEIEVLIETRGEGGYTIIAPSSGPVHETGEPYAMVRGSLGTIPTITPEERRDLLNIARSLDEIPEEPKDSYDWSQGTGSQATGSGGRPGDDYNDSTTGADVVALLERHGWERVHQFGDRTQVRRPGKSIGVSATVFDSGAFVCFTTSTRFDAYDQTTKRGVYSPFSVYALLEHGGDFSAAARALNPEMKVKLPKSDSEPEEETPERYVEPVDLLALMVADQPEEDWCVEPVLPARKHTGIVAKRGDGKSLFALDLAARKATGQAILSQKAGDPAHVVYLDLEMGPDDLYERLADLGWTIDNSSFGKLVDHLHYYQLIDLPPLDTEEGGRELENIVERHQATLVVIDTVSRVISGDENSSDTFRELFRHTETRLKRRGVTLARLDHLGKDVTKGSRGASGKEDALDVVWQLSQTATGSLLLKLTKGRQAWIPPHVTIHRDNWNGTLVHTVTEDAAPDWLVELAGLIDGLGVPEDAGIPTVQKALRDADQGRRRSVIAKAVRFRKGRSVSGNTPGTPPGNTSRNTPEHPPAETADKQGLFNREHPPEHPGTGKGVVSPPIGGNTPNPALVDLSAEDS